MEIIIKVLRGEDFKLDVSQTTTIYQIKQEIEKRIHVPLSQQKLLYMGRTLNDEHSISEYPIKRGTKLILITMKPESMRDIMFRSFRKYYNEEQSEQLAKEFIVDFEKKLKRMSLDDIERLSGSILCI